MSIAPVTGATPAASQSSATSTAERAAKQFERVLLEQLTKQLSATAAPEDDEGSAATSAYRDLLPGTMADALAAAGGIGIAAQLTRSMAAPTNAASGPGTATPSTATPGSAAPTPARATSSPAPTSTPQTGIPS